MVDPKTCTVVYKEDRNVIMLHAEFAESQFSAANVANIIVEKLHCAACRSFDMMMWRTSPKECFQWRNHMLKQSQGVYTAIIKEKKTPTREANKKSELTELNMGRRVNWENVRTTMLKKYPRNRY